MLYIYNIHTHVSTHTHTHTHTHTQWNNSHKKEWNLQQHGQTWRVLRQVKCQAEKDKYCMIALLCGIQKIKQFSKYNKKEADSQI